MECKLDLNVGVERLHSYRSQEKNESVSFKLGCLHRVFPHAILHGGSRELLKLWQRA